MSEVVVDEWLKARLELLEEEKKLSRLSASVAKKRRSLPRREVKEDYAFIGANGKSTLSALFGEHSQLIVYHMMMGAGAKSGCKLCSFFIDQFMGGLPHLKPRATLAVVAKNDFANIKAWISEKKVDWDNNVFYSSSCSTFSEDLQVSFTPEQIANKTCTYNFNRTWNYGSEAPGISVFYKDAETGRIYHTYSTYAAGLGNLGSVLGLLDLTPFGRDEEEKRNMWWVKHKEEYTS
jgi:predicted dithiol-disulfide oxidoreductase (DUF899 family)